MASVIGKLYWSFVTIVSHIHLQYQTMYNTNDSNGIRAHNH